MTHRVETVLGPIAPASLGVTLTHEHLSMDFEDAAFCPPNKADEEKTKCEFSLGTLGWIRQYPYSNKSNLKLCAAQAEVLEEMKMLKKCGGSTIVENTTHGILRDMNFGRKISEETGVNIIFGTGFYVDRVHPKDMDKRSVEELAAIMQKEMEEGCEGTSMRCGVMGELGCSWPLTSNEKKVLQASASVQAGGFGDLKGAPVIIHPGRDRDAPFEIMRIFQEAGGKAERTVMSHLDRTLHKDEDILEFAALGCYCEYDLFGIEVSYYQFAAIDMPSDAERIRRIRLLMENGFEDKITISHDIHTKHRLKAFGGHGYTHILENVVPMMRTRGITQNQIDTIMIENPKTWLSF